MDLKAQIVEKETSHPTDSFCSAFSYRLRGDYIGQKLREKSFDPKGKGTSTMLDDLVDDAVLRGGASNKRYFLFRQFRN